jgi:hypothetical protein
MKDIGYGKGYAYDHDAEDGFSGADYWPEGMEPQTYYRPVERGFRTQEAPRTSGRTEHEARGTGRSAGAGGMRLRGAAWCGGPARPPRSPRKKRGGHGTQSGKRFASAEWSPSGFGALNAVLVMDVLPDTIREAARFEQLPELSANWRIERWRGEDCFELSAEIDEARQRFTMRRGPGGWAFAPAPQGCPAG